MIRVPTEVAVSPHDGSQVRFEPTTQTFHDASGNSWTVDMLAGSRKAQRIRRWVRDNYGKGSE